MKIKVLLFLAICSIFLNFFLFGYFFFYKSSSDSTITSAEAVSDEDYPFISRRIFRESKNDIFINFMPLRQAIRDYISKQEDKIMLYFEYLPSGSTIGVNNDEEIEMASLAKLPTVMAIYDKIAKQQLKKDQILTLDETQIDKAYGSFWKQGVGTTISLDDAIEKTLIESDNTTHRMLYDLLSLEDKVNMFSQLDIRIELKNNALYSYITAKSYASILKSLYLSTYLTNEASNEILAQMSQSIFHDDLEAGVDGDVLVSHKTGNLERTDGPDVSNDCGIVYLPKRPYTICILIYGEDDEKVKEHMKYLSKMTYEYVKQVNIPTE